MEEDKIFFNIKEACQTVFGWENIEIEDACKNLEAHEYSGSSIISPLECPKRSQNESSVDVSKVHNLDIHCYPEPMIQVIKKHDRQIFTFDEYEISEINKIMKRVKKSSEKPNKEDSISNRPSIDELKMCLSLLEAVKICIDSKQKEKRDKQRKVFSKLVFWDSPCIELLFTTFCLSPANKLTVPHEHSPCGEPL